jgi:hypothetical protein
MATYTDRIVLVFPIATKNRLAAASLQTLEITESGKEFETLIPLDPSKVKDYATEFNLGFEAEKAALVAAHKTALDAANATIATRDATIAALEARVASLLTELPFNPRIIDATAFYNRITKEEFASLSVSDDETLRTIAKTILAYKTNDWPVIFESPEFQGLIGYLVGTSFLTAERAAQLTADATRAEAYDAD